jgi:hypothetical protein
MPERPCVHPIAKQIYRSYPVGRQSFSRACQGGILSLTITTKNPLPDNVQACLMTTLNSKDGVKWAKVPFVRTDARTLICRLTVEHPGLHSFRAEFSTNAGATWLRDTVPDAWVLIDPPQVDGLRVYTMIPTVSGTLGDWTKDLKRISDMGFNAIHLLPITTLDTSASPYAARDLFDVDHSYLTAGSHEDALSQLSDFVKEAQVQKIRLIFDLVLNHVGVNSTMARRAPDWIVPDQSQTDGLKRARYWCNDGWRTWNDLVLINYEHPLESIRSEIWAYMTDYALFWAKYAHDTGGLVRFDNLHSSDQEFVRAVTTALHAEYPEVGLLAEYFTDENTLLHTGPLWGLNLILATPWNCKFVPQLRDYLKYIHHVAEHVRYFMPITSHDCGAPAQEFGSADSTVPRYVAAALLGTGATGIPQGVEFGEKERINFIGRQPKMSYPTEQRFAKFIGQVNAILAKYPAFRHGANCQFVDDGHAAVIAAFRRETSTDALGFLVVCNFDTQNAQHIALNLTTSLGSESPFACRELLSGEEQTFPHSQFDLILPPCAARVLRFSKTT